MRGKWLYLSVVGAFGLYYGLGFPLPLALAPPPKEQRHAIVEETITPLEKGIRYVVNYFRQANQPPAPRIARQPPQAPAPPPVAAPEPAPPPQPARQFVEPPRAKNPGFTALAVR